MGPADRVCVHYPFVEKLKELNDIITTVFQGRCIRGVVGQDVMSQDDLGSLACDKKNFLMYIGQVQNDDDCNKAHIWGWEAVKDPEQVMRRIKKKSGWDKVDDGYRSGVP